VIRAFGSWNQALQAAGYDRPRPPAYTDQQMLDALRDWARRNGRPPTSGEWDGQPGRDAIAVRFGGWLAALAAAGLAPKRALLRWSDWTDEDILDGLRRLAAALGRPPRSADRVGRLGEYPSSSLVAARFGAWSAGLQAAGLQPGNLLVSDEQVLEALRSYHAQHGEIPTTTAWKRERLTPSLHAISRHFASWDAAITAAGLR
jgi:hypothetical protein